MKASELMQGNIVQYEYDGEKIPARVVEIYRNSVLVESVSGEYEPIEIDEAKIYPIEITPEILEKNGFENTSVIIVGTPKMRWVSEDERTEITIWIDDTTPMEIRKNVYYEDEESYTLPSPVCVHELQNVLRLCGIEKEITI